MHFTRHTSHVTRHTSHVTRHTSHITHHTSHVTHHTSHITHHTSHITHHTSHITHHLKEIFDLIQVLVFRPIKTFSVPETHVNHITPSKGFRNHHITPVKGLDSSTTCSPAAAPSCPSAFCPNPRTLTFQRKCGTCISS